MVLIYDMSTGEFEPPADDPRAQSPRTEASMHCPASEEVPAFDYREPQLGLRLLTVAEAEWEQAVRRR